MGESSGGQAVKTGYTSRLRESVLTGGAAFLARTRRTLWYVETLALSARYMQMLATSEWARGIVRKANRQLLWRDCARPRLAALPTLTALEFGVAEGAATEYWARQELPFAAWHGFDTFTGLPSSWKRAGLPVMEADVFLPAAGAGAVPHVEAPYPFHWHKGLIEETLRGFERPDTPLFVLVDVDLYEPTVVILDWLIANGRPGDIVYFDEAFDPWNEGLAIREALARGLRLRGIGYTGPSLLVELA